MYYYYYVYVHKCSFYLQHKRILEYNYGHIYTGARYKKIDCELLLQCNKVWLIKSILNKDSMFNFILKMRNKAPEYFFIGKMNFNIGSSLSIFISQLYKIKGKIEYYILEYRREQYRKYIRKIGRKIKYLNKIVDYVRNIKKK